MKTYRVKATRKDGTAMFLATNDDAEMRFIDGRNPITPDERIFETADWDEARGVLAECLMFTDSADISSIEVV